MDEIRRAVARATEREAAGHIDKRIPNILKTKLFRYLDPNIVHDKEAIFLLDYWVTEENPMEGILADPEFLVAFERVFNKYKNRMEEKTYYRGTTNKNRMNMQIGDIIDYTSRYTSWSGEKSVASNFNSPETSNIVLKYTSAGEESVHLFTQEDEYILKPHKFKIMDIQYERSLESGFMEKIYILDLMSKMDSVPVTLNVIPLYFSLIIAKLNPRINILDVNKQSNGRKDIYNLMRCNSAMKNVFFDNSGAGHLLLLLDFSYPREVGHASVHDFQKNLSNSEYYALLNSNDDTFINVQWAYELMPERIKNSDNNRGVYVNSDSFELITNFYGSRKGIVKKYLIQYNNYYHEVNADYFLRSRQMINISLMPKIIAFLLLNKINIDPRREKISVNHMQWMLDNGFHISAAIRSQILQTFDLAKLKFLFTIPQTFQTKQTIFLVSNSIGGLLHRDELQMLYMGPKDGKTILSEKDHRDFLTYLYSVTNKKLPNDFFINEKYIDFSYDIIYSMDPQRFNGFVQNLHGKNILISRLIELAVLHKLIIHESDVSSFYSQAKETFMYLINAGYLPEKETIDEIVLDRDYAVLDILRKNGANLPSGKSRHLISPKVMAGNKNN